MILLAAVVAQGADAVTMRFSHEANPLVLELGPTAYLAKLLLIVAVTALCWSLPHLRSTSSTRHFLRPMATLLASTMLAVGEFGVISNLLASGWL